MYLKLGPSKILNLVSVIKASEKSRNPGFLN